MEEQEKLIYEITFNSGLYALSPYRLKNSASSFLFLFLQSLFYVFQNVYRNEFC